MPGTGCQIPAYNHFLQHGFDTDYSLICDIDEFLEIDDDFDLDKLNADAVFVNWQIFGSCGEKEYRQEPVWKRFPTPAPIDCIYNDTLPPPVTECWHVKSIVRKSDKRKAMFNPHNVVIENGSYKQTNGTPVTSSPWQPPTWKGARLKHYITKSESEFYERRIGKTDACGNNIDTNKVIRWYKNLERYYAK